MTLEKPILAIVLSLHPASQFGRLAAMSGRHTEEKEKVCSPCNAFLGFPFQMKWDASKFRVCELDCKKSKLQVISGPLGKQWLPSSHRTQTFVCHKAGNGSKMLKSQTSALAAGSEQGDSTSSPSAPSPPAPASSPNTVS